MLRRNSGQRGRRPPRQLTLTDFRNRREENRRRHMAYQLDALEMQALLSSRRGLHDNTMLRAMGIPVPAPIYNPRAHGGKRMAVRRRRRRKNPSRARRIREAQRRAGQLSLPIRGFRRGGGNGGGGGGFGPRGTPERLRPRMLKPRPAPRGFISATPSPVRGLLGPMPGSGGGGGAMVVYTPPGGLRAPARRPRRRRRAPVRRARYQVRRAHGGATVVRPIRGFFGAPTIYPDAIHPPGGKRKRRARPGRRTVIDLAPPRKKQKPRKRRRPAPQTHAAPARKPRARPRPRPRPRLGASTISAAKYQGRARPPKLFSERLAAAKKRRKRGQKNVWAIRTIRRHQRIAGLVRRHNPLGGSTMARHAHRRRRRRNPALDIKGMIRSLMQTGLPALAGGAASSLIDNKVLQKQSPAVRYAAKVGEALVASVLLKGKPGLAMAAMAGILGTLGYDLGTKASGTMGTLNQISYLVSADRQAMNALVDASGNLQTVPSLNGMSGAMAGPNDVVLG